jgi:multimeric flavodoxin WrbA
MPSSTHLKEALQMGKIYIIFYSMYGHIYKMAQKIKEGVDKVPGQEGVLFQVRSQPQIACPGQCSQNTLHTSSRQQHAVSCSMHQA